jgi:cytoskeletal protein CcmA (bactofilin family)
MGGTKSARAAFTLTQSETQPALAARKRDIVRGSQKIIGRGTLQVDGEVEGDVQAAEVIIGEQGKVTGVVAGQQVVVRGKVSGVVCARNVALQASSEVRGDIHHMSLAIEQGAMFEGRSRRAADESALNSVIEGRSAGRSYTSDPPANA